MRQWLRVIDPTSFPLCNHTEHPAMLWCAPHGKHLSECGCIAPNLNCYDYQSFNGVLYGSKKQAGAAQKKAETAFGLPEPCCGERRTD